MRKILLLVFVLIAFVACVKKEKVNSPVVGTVDGENIYFKDVQPTLKFFKYMSAMQGRKISGKDSINMVKDIINQVAVNKIVLKKVSGNKDYAVADSSIEKEITKTLKRNFKGNDSAFTAALKKQGLTIKKYKKSIREGKIIKKYMDNLKNSITVDSNKVAEYFNKNMKRIRNLYKVSHILILKGKDSVSDLKSKARIDSVYKVLKKGNDFALLAKKVSQGPSAKNGGEIGWVSPKSLDPNFSKAMVALKQGEMSSVVKSAYGYHVIKLFGHKIDTTKLNNSTFNVAKKKIQNQSMQDAIKKITEGHKIEFKI